MEREQTQALVANVEQLLEQLEQLADPAARAKATETVQALLDLYGAGLERIVEEVALRDDGRIARALAEDELVSHLLLLHGLHPEPLEERVRGALEEVRPYLESHGGDVELLGLEGGVARLSLEGSCSGCPSSTMTLKLAIENAIGKAAPEIEEVLAEGASAPAQPGGAPLLQIDGPQATDGPPPAGAGAGLLQIELPAAPSPGGEQRPGEASWTMAGGMPELANGGALVKPIGGQPILFLKLDGRLYGYRPRCPACEQSLSGAALEGVELSCPGCGVRYDAMRAGRCLDRPQLHLAPVPLLVGDDGLAKVALAGAG
ncbi:MAG TPA: NifU family protein [Solirubrobacteraceae bacterium]|jgi:Fe-S cluster biogenesis protein NfuA/nitrite reductase/ring-hydroxylating ferredoxin subunit|nr:NifU family protein [Solirubrobacteraceae bacterium]